MIKAREAQKTTQNSKENAIALMENALRAHEDKFNEEIIKSANAGRVHAYLPFYVKYNRNFYQETAETICKFFFSYGYPVELINKNDSCSEIESIVINWEED